MVDIAICQEKMSKFEKIHGYSYEWLSVSVSFAREEMEQTPSTTELNYHQVPIHFKSSVRFPEITSISVPKKHIHSR